MSWRPENWEGKRRDTLEVPGIGKWGTCDIYEAGADAMLKALREEGIQFDLKKGDILRLSPAIVTSLSGKAIGRIVFIPDNEAD